MRVKYSFFKWIFLAFFLISMHIHAKEQSGNIHFLETIIVDFPANITINQGITNSYEVSGNEKILGMLKIVVRGGKLVFEKRKLDIKQDLEPLEIKITVRHLHEIYLKSSTDATLNDLRSQKLLISSQGDSVINAKGLDILEFGGEFKGSVKFKGEGKIREQEFYSQGYAEVDFFNVDNKITSIKAQGEGVYQILCSEKLWLELNGNILCSCKGQPAQIDSKLSGKSKLQKL